MCASAAFHSEKSATAVDGKLQGRRRFDVATNEHPSGPFVASKFVCHPAILARDPKSVFHALDEAGVYLLRLFQFARVVATVSSGEWYLYYAWGHPLIANFRR